MPADNRFTIEYGGKTYRAAFVDTKDEKIGLKIYPRYGQSRLLFKINTATGAWNAVDSLGKRLP